MEPIILELEREKNDLLIIAHETVLRVLYGYLMACNATDIPKLSFPRDEIVEVSVRFETLYSYNSLPFRSSQPVTITRPNESRSLICQRN